MSPLAYLVDSRHTYVGTMAVDSMPLNIGFVKAVLDRDVPELESRLMIEAGEMIDAMRREPADVVLLSNYCWNEELSFALARVARAIHPEVLIVMGGPNLPLEATERRAFLESRPEIDAWVVGEGEFATAELLRRHLDDGLARHRLGRNVVDSVLVRAEGEIVAGPERKRTRALDAIPSPWLNGIMDRFFDGRLSPLWETNRGCPFTCSFCVQGTRYYSKVNYFGLDRLKEEIHYIGRRIHELSPNMGTLRIADPNYGMYERDVELSEEVGRVQRRYGWPTYIDATTGKNRPERIIESLEKVGGALVLYQAVQSLDEEVLRRIKRKNIRLDAYARLQVHVRGRGLRSSSDLILGLPGETLDSHLASMRKLIDAGVDRLNNFQCILIKGSELEHSAVRTEFGFETRHRLVPKSFGVYNGTLVAETEEIVVSTETLSFDDYLVARLHHLAAGLFLNHSRFKDLLDFVARLGQPRSEAFVALVEAMRTATGPVGRMRDAFLEETRSELFGSCEEARNYCSQPENLERLRRGEIGDNLIYKYTARACLRAWDAVADLALSVFGGLWEKWGLSDANPGFRELWPDWARFQRLRFASGASLDELISPVRGRFIHDVPAWLRDARPETAASFAWSRSKDVRFELSDDDRVVVERSVRTWGLQASGLPMLIKRINPQRLERIPVPE